MTAKDPKEGCNPLGDVNFSMTLVESLYAMLIYFFVTHFFAFLILKVKSN